MTESSLQSEALEAIASARELLVELLEEGIDAVEAARLDPVVVEDGATARDAPAGSTATTAAVETPTEQTAEPRSQTTAPSLESVEETLHDCDRCGLCRARSKIVFGSGNANADLMFIGEGPGEQEDRQGLPFVGPAGELLTSMIEKGIKIPRSEVYICNIVKCRPPRNRNPLPDEVAACKPFLDSQIDAIQPKVIVSLGKPAAGLLLGREVASTRLRGRWQEYRGIPLMPTLHPAYILRQYTAENRRLVWEDLKAAVERIR